MTFQRRFHIIKDPVHGSMQFTDQEHDWIAPFIDTENFQRLRYIKQVGLADWFFPGAVHTRFSHGIGCCYIGSQICNKLDLGDHDKQLVMIACLLHDIGHGPFSHLFEEVFYERAIRHEMWTSFFLEEYACSGFLSQYNALNPKFRLTKNKMQVIQNMIMHGPVKNNLLADIVSSQLDADRLDYLLRDSHFCGVTYGHFELRWLLHCLTIIEKDGMKRLGITYKGLGMTEQFLMARRLMIRNIYHYGKKLGTEFLVTQFLKEVANGLAHDPRFSGLPQTPLTDFLKATNELNRAIVKTHDRTQLINEFMRQNYELYKQLCDYDIFLFIRHLAQWDCDHPAIEIAKRLQMRKLPKVIPVPMKAVKKIKEMIKHFQQNHFAIAPWQLALLSLPHSFYNVKEDPILMEDATGHIHYLHESSLLVSAVSDKREGAALLNVDMAIFHQPEIQKMIKALG